MIRKPPSQKLLARVLEKYEYEPSLGTLHIKSYTISRIKIQKRFSKKQNAWFEYEYESTYTTKRREIGSPHCQGGVKCVIEYQGERWNVLGHVLAWYLYYGKLPTQTVTHIDFDITNNKINNLREVSRAEAISLSKPRKKYKGVINYSNSSHPIDRPYVAQLSSKGVTYFIDFFETEELAAKAYDKKAKELFGKYARLNFPKEKK